MRISKNFICILALIVGVQPIPSQSMVKKSAQNIIKKSQDLRKTGSPNLFSQQFSTYKTQIKPFDFSTGSSIKQNYRKQNKKNKFLNRKFTNPIKKSKKIIDDPFLKEVLEKTEKELKIINYTIKIVLFITLTIAAQQIIKQYLDNKINKTLSLKALELLAILKTENMEKFSQVVNKELAHAQIYEIPKTNSKLNLLEFLVQIKPVSDTYIKAAQITAHYFEPQEIETILNSPEANKKIFAPLLIKK